jgi:signal transduction histidine kinase
VEAAGLSLAIAKGIAEMHHAYMTVASELIWGASFKSVLPNCFIKMGRI